MCAIFGFVNFAGVPGHAESTIKQMARLLNHRGPDGFAYHAHKNALIGHRRLAIVGLKKGKQPLQSENNIWSACAGEIFNYREIKERLISKGVIFKTETDCEILPYLYESTGTAFLKEINGQYAGVLWDEKNQKLILYRDRLGIAPLFYFYNGQTLIFASEIKAILAYPGVQADLDTAALQEEVLFWGTLPPKTMFQNIYELEPGHSISLNKNGIQKKCYWQLDFSVCNSISDKELQSTISSCRELLIDSVKKRLPEEVPGGFLLSGGVDSSLIAAIANKECGNTSTAFSIRFKDKALDESRFHAQVTSLLKMPHKVLDFDEQAAQSALEKVVFHSEKPFLRSGLIAFYLLADYIKKSGVKVVLAGEGADEMFLGYDIFKEIKIRAFCARSPVSKRRPSLYGKIYTNFFPEKHPDYLKSFFFSQKTTEGYPAAFLSRWNASKKFLNLLHEDLRMDENEYLEILEACLPQNFKKWDSIQQAQYLESSIFMRDYLLGAQGDRMLMAHSLEGRYPYLDHRLVELCAKIPASVKMPVLRDKRILRQIASAYLPAEIAQRPKKNFLAPALAFAEPVDLSIFDKAEVKNLTERMKRGADNLSFTDQMAYHFAGSLSIFYKQFMTSGRTAVHES